MEQNLCEFPLNLALMGSQLHITDLVNCRPLDCELSKPLVCRLDNPNATLLPISWDLNIMTSSEEQNVWQEKSENHWIMAIYSI